MPLSARFTASLGAEYSIPVGGDLEMQFGAGYYHRSSQSSGVGAPFTIPAWDTIDLRTGLKADNWTLSLFCKNCANEIRPISIGSDGGDANPLAGPPVLTLSQRFSFDSVSYDRHSRRRQLLTLSQAVGHRAMVAHGSHSDICERDRNDNDRGRIA